MSGNAFLSTASHDDPAVSLPAPFGRTGFGRLALAAAPSSRCRDLLPSGRRFNAATVPVQGDHPGEIWRRAFLSTIGHGEPAVRPPTPFGRKRVERTLFSSFSPAGRGSRQRDEGKKEGTAMQEPGPWRGHRRGDIWRRVPC